MDLLKAGDILKQAPTDLRFDTEHNAGCGYRRQTTLHTGWERMDIRGVGSRSLDVGRRYERSKFRAAGDQLEHRPARNIEQVEVMKGASLCALRLIGLEQGDQHPHETAERLTPTTKCPRLCPGYTTIRFMTNMKGRTSRTHDGSETSMYRADSTCFPMTDTAIKDTTGVCDSRRQYDIPPSDERGQTAELRVQFQLSADKYADFFIGVLR